MATYVKELLWDVVDGLSSEIDRIDMQIGLQRLVSQGKISRSDVEVVNKYYAGFRPEEIGDHAKDCILTVLHLLEQETRYTDDAVISMGLDQFPSYRKIAPYLKKKLTKEVYNL